MRSPRAALLVSLLPVSLLVAFVAPPAGARQQLRVVEAVQAMLDERAAAVRSNDSSAFERTMEGAAGDFLARQQAMLRRIHTLPLSEYRLLVDDGEFGDLARASDAVTGAEETRILQVREIIGIRGYDTKPGNEEMFLTVIRRGDRWTVYDDDAVEPLGLKSMRHLWDFGEIRMQERDGIMVVFHPSEQSIAGQVLDMAARARTRARDGWPFEWRDPIVIMIPSSVAEIERIFQTTFDLSAFVAFAASSLDRSEGWQLTGNRVFLHWANLRRYSASFQELVLTHEFTHLATRDIAGPYITAIMDEGIAQFYGEGGGDSTRLRQRVRNRTLPGTLVPDWYFLAGPRDDIFLAYEEAASFIGYLANRFGRDAGAQAYRALGTIDPISPGTWRYHLDRVLATEFGESYRTLERAWFQDVMRRYS